MWTSQGLNLGPPDYESGEMWIAIIIIFRLKTLHVEVVAAVEVAVGDGFHDVGLARALITRSRMAALGSPGALLGNAVDYDISFLIVNYEL